MAAVVLAPITREPVDGSRRWGPLVERIRKGEEAAFNELYALFVSGVRRQLCRALGAHELEDRVHDTFLIVAQAIHSGDLREPERLMGFVRTVVRRQIAMYINHASQLRRDQMDFSYSETVIDETMSPEERVIADQQSKIVHDLLREIPGRDGEILNRYYLRGQTPEEICSDMGLSINQFRLLKSRAKARFSEASRRRLEQRARRKIFKDTLRFFPAARTEQ